jgi:sugar phosphate permease
MMTNKVRYLLIMLIFLVSAVVYLDRSNISIAGPYLAQDYGIDKIQLGWVFSAFLLGYAAFQIPAGWVVGKLGSAQDADLWPDLVERRCPSSPRWFRRRRAARCGC